jgi:putative membrane protein
MRKWTRLALVPAAALGIVVLAAAPALAAVSGQDTTWLQAAHQGNLAEIAAGQAAQQSATNAQVKQLGAMFVQDHTRLDGQLTQAAQQLGVQLPTSPTPAQQQQLADVRQKTGAAFDSAWTSTQLAAHATTLAATQQELQAGSDATVLGLARTATPVVQHHLAELQALAAQLGLPTSVNGGSGGQAATGTARTVGWALAGAGGLMILTGAAGRVRRRAASA